MVLTCAMAGFLAGRAVAAGGGVIPPLLSQKRREIKGRDKRHSISLEDSIQSYFCHFLAQVNIEVTRGH